jgi:hypothetical protein
VAVDEPTGVRPTGRSGQAPSSFCHFCL